MVPTTAFSGRPGPGRGRLALLIIGGGLMMTGLFLLTAVLATRLILTPDRFEVLRLSDDEQRVSVELPRSWWDETPGDAGGSRTDETGVWAVPDIEAGGPAQRWLSLWIVERLPGERNIAEQHETYVKTNCEEFGCTLESSVDLLVDGQIASRQEGRREDGSRIVFTTIQAKQVMIFVVVDGEDSAAGLAEITKISDSVRAR